MKHPFSESIEIPAGITCTFAHHMLTVTKDGSSLMRKVDLPGITLTLKDNTILLATTAANKNERKYIKSYLAHFKNMFVGLTEKYVYQLEACNVHFPMTLKKEGNRLLITNFLGEKIPRAAKILQGVELEIKGAKITLSSADKEAAGHTAANIEKATLVRNRDRRVFQDGIFITAKPIGGTA